MSSRSGKLKQDSTAHLLEWWKSKTLPPPHTDEDAKPWELSFTDGGNAEWYGHFGRQFVGFLQN